MTQAIPGAHRLASQAELASPRAVRGQKARRMTAEVDLCSSRSCVHTLAHLHTPIFTYPNLDINPNT